MGPSFVCKPAYCTRRRHPNAGRHSVVWTAHRVCFATQRTYSFRFPKKHEMPAAAKRQTGRHVQAMDQRLKFCVSYSCWCARNGGLLLVSWWLAVSFGWTKVAHTAHKAFNFVSLFCFIYGTKIGARNRHHFRGRLSQNRRGGPRMRPFCGPCFGTAELPKTCDGLTLNV